MRRSHCQPYSCRGVLCHATLPYRLVPLIKAIKDLWSGRDKFRTPRIIITVYFILVNLLRDFPSKLVAVRPVAARCLRHKADFVAKFGWHFI